MTKKWFQSRLIFLIKPKKMSVAEYQLKCAIRGIVASVDDPVFMRWVVDEAYCSFNDELHKNVRSLLIRGFKQHLILDFSKDKDCSYISDLIPDIVLREHNTKAETEKLFRVILEEYRDTKLGEVVYHINKGLGITTMCYFKDKVDGVKQFNDILALI